MHCATVHESLWDWSTSAAWFDTPASCPCLVSVQNIRQITVDLGVARAHCVGAEEVIERPFGALCWATDGWRWLHPAWRTAGCPRQSLRDVLAMEVEAPPLPCALLGVRRCGPPAFQAPCAHCGPLGRWNGSSLAHCWSLTPVGRSRFGFHLHRCRRSRVVMALAGQVYCDGHGARR